MCGMGVEYVLKNSLLRRSLDNVTVVIIGFSNFKHSVFGREGQNGSSRVDQNSVEEEPTSKNVPICSNKYPEQNKTIERTRSANLPKYQGKDHKLN